MVRDDPAGYWRATRLRAFVTLTVAALGVAVAFALAGPMNSIAVLGFPLGVLLVANVLPLFLVFLGFWHATRQDHLDRRFGMAEED